MTLLDCLNRIHALLEGDTSTPLTGEDYDLRVLLVNDAIEEWGQQSDVKWQELYGIDTSNTADGTTTRFALPQDFHSINGPVLLYDPTHQVFTPIGTTTAGRSTEFVSNSNLACWVEGAELVFNQAPSDGVGVHIAYYKTPTALTQTTDVLPMSNPRYVVHYVVARLVEQSGDYTRYNTNMQKAEELLAQMKIQNDRLGEGVANQVQSLSPGFGV